MSSIERYAVTKDGSPLGWTESYSWPPAAESRMFTWEQAVRVLRKRAKLILLVTGLIAASVAAAALTMKNVYQPTARIEIDPLESGIKTLQEIENPNEPADLDYLQTQAQILQSDALSIRVVRELHLDKLPGFVSGAAAAGATQPPPAGEAGRPADSNTNPLSEQYDLAERTPQESRALDIVQENLSVSPVRNSRLIEVSYESTDPALAQLITNTVVTQFIEQNYRSRYTTTMQASDWLSAQLEDLRQKVQKSSEAVAEFQQRYGYIDTEDRDDPQTQLMTEVNHELSSAQADRIQAEAYARMVDFGQADALPELREDQVYQNLMTRYADIRAQLAEARTVYGDENANVKKLEGESDELSSQIRSERDRVSDRTRATFDAAEEKERMLLKSREKLRASVGSANSHLMEYQLLKNEATANAELYNTLQGRLKEAGIYAGLRSNNIHVIDLAPKLMTPTGPHRRFLVAIGSLGGLFVALVAAFGLEGFENTIRTPDDVKDCVGLASLAMLPAVAQRRAAGKQSAEKKFDGHGLRLRRGSDPWWGTIQQLSECEGIRGLRTSLSIQMAASGVPPRVVLVSSSLQGEGKTTVAVNLAVAFARRGKSCLLIDADLRRPCVAEAFRLAPSPGLSEVLEGAVDAQSAIVNARDIPGLSILPSGEAVPDPAGLLSSERTREFLGVAKQRFDCIVIDSPPTIPFSDARLLALVSDAVLIVSRYGYTTRRAIARGTQLLEEVRAPIAGVVLNGIDLGSADYHYYNYGFSRGLIQDSYYQYPPDDRARRSPVRAAPRARPLTPNPPPDSDTPDKSRGAHA